MPGNPVFTGAMFTDAERARIFADGRKAFLSDLLVERHIAKNPYLKSDRLRYQEWNFGYAAACMDNADEHKRRGENP